MNIVFYFTADWCAPCRKMKPLIQELNRESTSVKFQFIDADDNVELIKKFEIKSIPTFILIDIDGNEINRINGLKTRKELEDFING